MSPRVTPVSPAIAALAFAARALLVVSLVLLTQFMLGIVVNLFINVPPSHPGAGMASYVVGSWQSVGWALEHEWPFLASHVIVGLGLVVASITFLIRGLLTRAPAGVLVWNFTGAAGALFASLNGMYFLVHPAADTASLLMAIGLAIAVASVIIQLFLVARASRHIATSQTNG